MLFLFIWLGCALLCAVIAGFKNRTMFGWFLLGLIFGVFALLIIIVVGDPTRVHTVVVQNTVTTAPAPTIEARPVGSIRDANPDWAPARQQPAGAWPGNAAAQLPPPRPTPRHTGYEMQPAVIALRVLAEAGEGFDEQAVDAVMTYLEAENGAAEYTRREAAALMQWMRELPVDDAAIREALNDLQGAVISVEAFLAAMATIAGAAPGDRQARWVAFLRKRLGA